MDGNFESQEDRFLGAFRIRVPRPETPRVIRVFGSAQTERDGLRITELEVLNQRRLTKIKRLREGIRSLQACHERDQREILNLRQKLAEAGAKIVSLDKENDSLAERLGFHD